jgi:chromosomal replication initiation ATPase DnaA
MRDAPKQLAFDLPLDPRYGREDFLVSPSNDAAYGLIERWPDWSDTTLLLRGPARQRQEPSGLHLGHSRQSLDRARGGESLQMRCLTSSPTAPGDRGCRRWGSRDEAALFHLLNVARERKASVLITCQAAPDRWGLQTADLLSRLRLAPSVALEAPDDALLKAVLVKLFVDRQLVVDTSVVDYIALRIERSLGRAADIVAALDREALSRGRRISRPMTAALLGSGLAEDQESDDAE